MGGSRGVAAAREPLLVLQGSAVVVRTGGTERLALCDLPPTGSLDGGTIAVLPCNRGPVAFIEPPILPGKPGGNKRTVIERDVVNGVTYIPQHGLPVSWSAKGAAVAQRVNVPPPLGRQRHAGPHPLCVMCSTVN